MQRDVRDPGAAGSTLPRGGGTPSKEHWVQQAQLLEAPAAAGFSLRASATAPLLAKAQPAEDDENDHNQANDVDDVVHANAFPDESLLHSQSAVPN
jgi:hypothetical protein